MTFFFRFFPVVCLCSFMLQNSASGQSDTTEWTENLHEFWQRRPALSLFYGVTHLSWDALTSGIPNPGLVELRLGRARQDVEDESARIVQNRYDFFALAAISNSLGTRALEGDVNLDLWRLGLGHNAGYGYAFGNPAGEQAFLLYHGGALGWSRLRVKDNIASTADSTQLALYDKAFRFGMHMEAGASYRLLPQCEITLAYERGIIFRRHQVGKWIGSVATEGVGQWLVDRFVHRVMKLSPASGPVVAFLLKNGLAFGMYQLRRTEMFFPFSSESPLTDDVYKVGMTIVW